MCVQEEGRLAQEIGECALTMTQDKGKKERKENNHIPPIAKINKESRCFFCKKKGHMKKDCYKHKAWLGKKGNYFSFVCFESNMADICHDTWFIDSGSTIHIPNTMQGFSS